eukprot:TRINITY_DN40236_c0_g1_i1.p1 TRINITY_DN40236_c0_g1~~TRINITY_DN40236_c0_g1_i1.p1  ORF type:complete len:532 (+),score=45.03 TRINITY_DN40236_c0_g1_i1:21-1616(+)
MLSQRSCSSSARMDRSKPAGERLPSRSTRRKNFPDGIIFRSSIQMSERSGDNWCWSPKHGNSPIQRELSADAWRRHRPELDLFSSGSGAASSEEVPALTPRARRCATMAAMAASAGAAKDLSPRSERPGSSSRAKSAERPTLSLYSAGAESPMRRATSTPRTGRPTPPQQAQNSRPTSPRGLDVFANSEPFLGELPSEQPPPQARVQAAKTAHHSPGLWREMPVHTRWGPLESTQYPGAMHASAAARASKPFSDRTGKRRLPADAPGQAPADADQPVPDPPNSARTYYLDSMHQRSPIPHDPGHGASSVTPPDRPSELSPRLGRPRGSSSPGQRSASLACGQGSARHHGVSPGPWHMEEEAIKKSPRAHLSPRSAVSELDPVSTQTLPAGMHYQCGPAAAALESVAVEADGSQWPNEPLQAAIASTDDRVHPVEGSVSPRRFCPPSKEGKEGRVPGAGEQRPRSARSSSRTGVHKATRGYDNPKLLLDSHAAAGFPGPELQLDLAGFRRARAASAGFGQAALRARNHRWRL